MSDVSLTPSRKVFLSDVRMIREHRGRNLDALSRETMIPAPTLEMFEMTGLFDDPVFNRVYLRLLVGAYANGVGIPVNAMLKALDEALLSTYDGALARLLFPEPTRDEDPPPPIIPDETPSEPFEEVGSPGPVKEVAMPAAPETIYIPRQVEDSPQVESPAQDEDSTPTPLSRRARYRRLMQPRSTRGKRIAVGGLSVAVLVVAVAVLMPGSDGTDLVPEKTPEVVLIDSVQARLEPQFALGEAFFVTVYAADTLIQGMRIFADHRGNKLWIERYEAKVLQVLDSLTIENQLSQTHIHVEGYEIPVVAPDPGKFYVLRRAELEDMAEGEVALVERAPIRSDTVCISQAAGC